MKRLLFLSIFLCAFAPPSIQTNNDGVKSFEQENYNEAFNKFVEALSKAPENALMHFNLANTFHKNKETKKALTELEAVEAMGTADDETKYMAMFNAGNMAVEAKDLPKAMDYYQKALKYKPDSKEVKTNIELALKQEQGGGGGGGDNDQEQNQEDKDNKDGKDGKDNKDKKQDPKNNENKDDKQGQKKQPQPFKSKDLNESDVRRILEELKRQENEIRAKSQKNKPSKEEPASGKDW
ncbi:MAG: hypothetical protein IPM57_11865 [Oligoflexia bacterium]|nr:hypothetical protein [Oligoflexia bacterium]